MANRNIIDAIITLVKTKEIAMKNNHLVAYYNGINRANNEGDALEEYVKDLFAGTFEQMESSERLKKWSEVFSYLGNNSNPPDIMLKDGDAIEVKKIQSKGSALALNSSFPKHTLKASSHMISNACKTAEEWMEKDIIYVVGVVKDKKIHSMSLVYGMDYCASEECYLKIKNKIKEGVETISNIEFTETKELGHVNKVDPLGITYLRVRGMWGIENPWKVFNYIYERNEAKKFNFMAIINEEKWNSFENTEKLERLNAEGLVVKDVEIKNPDNPAQLKKAKLITYTI